MVFKSRNLDASKGCFNKLLKLIQISLFNCFAGHPVTVSLDMCSSMIHDPSIQFLWVPKPFLILQPPKARSHHFWNVFESSTFGFGLTFWGSCCLRSKSTWDPHSPLDKSLHLRLQQMYTKWSTVPCHDVSCSSIVIQVHVDLRMRSPNELQCRHRRSMCFSAAGIQVIKHRYASMSCQGCTSTWHGARPALSIVRVSLVYTSRWIFFCQIAQEFTTMLVTPCHTSRTIKKIARPEYDHMLPRGKAAVGGQVSPVLIVGAMVKQFWYAFGTVRRRHLMKWSKCEQCCSVAQYSQMSASACCFQYAWMYMNVMILGYPQHPCKQQRKKQQIACRSQPSNSWKKTIQANVYIHLKLFEQSHHRNSTSPNFLFFRAREIFKGPGFTCSSDRLGLGKLGFCHARQSFSKLHRFEASAGLWASASLRPRDNGPCQWRSCSSQIGFQKLKEMHGKCQSQTSRETISFVSCWILCGWFYSV